MPSGVLFLQSNKIEGCLISFYLLDSPYFIGSKINVGVLISVDDTYVNVGRFFEFYNHEHVSFSSYNLDMYALFSASIHEELGNMHYKAKVL